jgi:ketosteroid isomerase-like protein
MIGGMGKPSRMFSAALLGLLSLSLNAGGQAAQPAKPSTETPAFREMQAVEDRWSDAITKRDQYGMELVLAPQFIGISASGDVTTRNQQIAGLFVKGTGPDSLEQKVISVRFVGEVAIVNGTYVISWKTEKGPFQEKGIFSHVFEHVHNNWLCLNSQRTVVAENVKGTVQEKPKSTKRSDAALPMHIPLVYKGPESTQPAPPAATPPP